MLNIPEAPAKVLGQINYTVDNGKEPSYYFYVPEEEVEMNPPGTDVHDVEVPVSYTHLTLPTNREV